ncbi:hypothetical protein [Williamsia sp. CHRR-6]|uniref:hypothetical protein n=1 Tax=Williamsia sp. CHRR-6 TaxID=2835871 RepID=UPI001BD9DD14|nr:hypothetical protein [Williamsia sp. CHRR-6]MBT0568634.1 hypothetical protein [Williamsia sp. CHRR-6]
MTAHGEVPAPAASPAAMSSAAVPDITGVIMPSAVSWTALIVSTGSATSRS